jgi:subtilisin family serine protease
MLTINIIFQNEEYYYCANEKIFLRRSNSCLVLEFNKDDLVIKEDLLYKINGKDDYYIFGKKINRRTFLFYKETSENNGRSKKFKLSKRELKAKELIVYSCNVGEKLVLTDELFLRFNEKVTNDSLNKFLLMNDLTFLRKFENDPNLYLLQLRDFTNALNKINALNEIDMVDYSNPNFRRILRRQSAPEDNPGFESQWALKESHDFNINIKKAWEITKGKSNITIAFIDDGVDYNHEDLNVDGKLVKGFDFVYPPALDPSPTGEDSHGTHCAGVASAAMNKKGIIGVAPGCKIMGLRVAHGDPWSNSQLLANAIDAFKYAIEKNVDVISCSWGLNDIPPQLYNIINEAATEGRRNKKGIVICMAAGNYYRKDLKRNDFGVIASARLNSVISVGAYGLDGKNKIISEEDLLSKTEKWGSRFEPLEAVDVLAPGMQIFTTDVTGVHGNSSDDYYELFNGTSASTPFVSGAAALILSVNEDLTSSQVREIIIKSTEDNQGRLNVYKALKLAQKE